MRVRECGRTLRNVNQKRGSTQRNEKPAATSAPTHTRPRPHPHHHHHHQRRTTAPHLVLRRAEALHRRRREQALAHVVRRRKLRVVRGDKRVVKLRQGPLEELAQLDVCGGALAAPRLDVPVRRERELKAALLAGAHAGHVLLWWLGEGRGGGGEEGDFERERGVWVESMSRGRLAAKHTHGSHKQPPNTATTQRNRHHATPHHGAPRSAPAGRPRCRARGGSCRGRGTAPRWAALQGRCACRRSRRRPPRGRGPRRRAAGPSPCGTGG